MTCNGRFWAGDREQAEQQPAIARQITTLVLSETTGSGDGFMKWNKRSCHGLTLFAAMAVLMMSGPVTAQLAPPSGASFGGSVPQSKNVVSGIAWYGVLQDGLAEAKRTDKPILFLTAAAQCQGVPGMW